MDDAAVASSWYVTEPKRQHVTGFAAIPNTLSHNTTVVDWSLKRWMVKHGKGINGFIIPE